MLLSIIIPAYNEEATILKLLRKLEETKWGEFVSTQIIVINDCSTDSTLNLLNNYNKNKNIKIIDNKSNLGKSRSVIKGILVSSGDYIVIQDADLEYDPNDIKKILDYCLKNNLDFVYGNRFTGNNKLIYKSFYLGNILVSTISNIFTFPRLKKLIPDMEVCYKLVKGEILREIAKSMSAKSNFGFEPELTAKLARFKFNGRHLKFNILPISYFPRTIEEGKKIRWKDGFKAVIEIIKYNIF